MFLLIVAVAGLHVVQKEAPRLRADKSVALVDAQSSWPRHKPHVALVQMRSNTPRMHLLVCAGLFILVVVLSISIVLTGDGPSFAKRGIAAHTTAHTPTVLCQNLVIPAKKEFVFALKSFMTVGRQNLRFDVIDPENKAFCAVRVCEEGPAAFRGMHGIMLQTTGGEMLAFLATEDFLVDRSCILPLFRPSGELFGHLLRDKDPALPRRYHIVAAHTSDALLNFHGDFREQAVHVHNGYGQLVATSERHTFTFSLDQHLQVRVAPSVDASLVILGLLGIGKMESER